MPFHFRFFCFMFLCFISCSERKEKNDILRFGVEGTRYPYSFIADSTLRGFDIDLGNEIAKELNKKAEFHIMKWSDMITALQNNK